MKRLAVKHAPREYAQDPTGILKIVTTSTTVPATKLYFTACNTARLALQRLREHLRQHDASPLPLLEGEGRRLRLEAAERRLRALP